MSSNLILSVLLVDDEKAVANLVEKHLDAIEEGWEAKFEHVQGLKGEEVVDYIISRNDHVLLMDYYLGTMNGMEITDKLRKRAYQRPVILLTGKGDMDMLTEALRRGADDYLAKDDLSPETLRDSIKFVLNRYFNTDHKGRLRELRSLWVGNTDQTTGLYNRQGLEVELKEKIENNKSFTFLALGFRNLRRLNEEIGVRQTDEILEEVGNFVEEKSPDGSINAKVQGGDFILALPEGHGKGRADQLANNLEAHLAKLKDQGEIKSFGRINIDHIVEQREINKENTPPAIDALLTELSRKKAKV